MPDLILSDNDAPHLPITNLNQLIETLQRAPVDKFFSVAKYIPHFSKRCAAIRNLVKDSPHKELHCPK